MTDRLDLEAVRARVLDRHSALSFRADCIALIAEVERLQEKESEGSWLREQLRRTQAEMDRLRADVARKDEALRQMLRRVPVLAVSASESDRFALTEMATQIALTALSESEEQAVSRSRPERGTEGVGLSGETAHSSDSETSA